MPDNDMVTITRAEYDRLIEAEMKLDALLGAVIEVEDTGGWDDAMQMYREMLGES